MHNNHYNKITSKQFLSFFFALVLYANYSHCYNYSSEDKLDASNATANEYRALSEKVYNTNPLIDKMHLLRLEKKAIFSQIITQKDHTRESVRDQLCADGSSIGRMHLDANDPERALVWQRKVRIIDSMNVSGDILHNEICAYYLSLLRDYVEKSNWTEGRNTIQRMDNALPDEVSVEDAKRIYVSARSAAIRKKLGSDGAASVIPEIVEEQKYFPEQNAFSQVWDDVRSSLQIPFEKAVASRRQVDAEQELQRQQQIIKDNNLEADFIPITKNEDQLIDLRDALLPDPIQRPFGSIRSSTIRFELLGNYGNADYSLDDETISDSVLSPTVLISYRRFSNDRTRYGWGIDFNGFYSSGSNPDADTSATSLLGSLSGQFLIRGERWSSTIGFGISYFNHEHIGLALQENHTFITFSDFNIYGEYAVHDIFSVFSGLSFGQTSGYRRFELKTGFRYYAAPNFSVGLQVQTLSLSCDFVDMSDKIKTVTTETLTIGPTVLLQF